ncbi:serine protease [Streptomyces sp. NPDC091272]|uniref:S1 family peptidase n=1 Tax=Streptomyces sp. NPDC091272 TaxID=3365981 RepID=UPI0037F7E55A
MEADGDVHRDEGIYASWRLRLWRGDPVREVCGAGVLLTADRALTCAHVAVDRDTPLWVDFVAAPGAPAVRARVTEDGWFPSAGPSALPGENEKELDVAVLALEAGVPSLRPARLHRELVTGERVLMTGHPEEAPAGLTLGATVRGLRERWIQLDPERGNVLHGFSGAGVSVDPGPRHREPAPDRPPPPLRVVGLVVSDQAVAQHRLPTDYDYMVPVDEIARAVPLVAGLAAPFDWDDALWARVWTWFHGQDQPSVKISVLEEGSDRHRTFRFARHLADVDHDAAAPGGVRALAEQVVRTQGDAVGDGAACRDWLLTGQYAEARRATPYRLRGSVLVTGLDRAPEREATLALLGRAHAAGLRLLLVCDSYGEPKRQAEQQLLDPALRTHSRALVEKLYQGEKRRRAQRKYGRGAGSTTGRPHPPDVAVARHEDWVRATGQSDPRRRIRALRKLLRRLDRDLYALTAELGRGTGE